MKLKNDWTLGHFLYYISWFMIFGLISQFITIHIPNLTGSNSITSIKNIDALVMINTEDLGIENRIYRDDGGYLYLGSSFHTNPMIISDSEEALSGYYIILLTRLLKFLALYIFYYTLNRILRSVIDNNPFDIKNSWRLYVMGISVLSLSFIHFLQSVLFSHYFNENMITEKITFETSFMGGQGSLTFGLAIVLLGYVFKEASRVYEEQKLTI